ncbi:MAG: hypothetical protein KJ970_03410 [Candidatus Eisenbacteria bacterium]|uniref:Uncharacterized protein n=1 Tax=Eiseniibacteriota bacterium TaxID=2212470 RepID=A0A948W526_UNCEI|nr:hypothetical protein [Candidatus Eisenbacteria bacterium]MBU1948796.1 hypothetical protein [Candidatus Eisenbacteria bacterium]MBU2689949.1 hypothetical protein [Candidatus Eisenbacteria bacterium]
MSRNPKKKKRRKPRGTSGHVKIELGQDQVSSTHHPLIYPDTKEELEFFIANAFLKQAKQAGMLDWSGKELVQNPTDDFDFCIGSDNEADYLELMEIAPIEPYQSYDEIPNEYRPYDFAQFILKRVLGKSRKYLGSTSRKLVLLTYNTDQKLTLVPPTSTMLQKWLATEKHCFCQIYYYKPIEPNKGLLETLYPAANEQFEYFRPEDYREMIFWGSGVNSFTQQPDGSLLSPPIPIPLRPRRFPDDPGR